MLRCETSKKRIRPCDTSKLQVNFAKFMKEYYAKNPSATELEMMQRLRTHFDLDCGINQIKMCVTKLIRKYHTIRYKLENSKPSVQHMNKRTISRCYPFFMDIEKALQSSEHFRTRILKSQIRTKKSCSGKAGETIKTAAIISTQDEWQTADVKPSVAQLILQNDRRGRRTKKKPESPHQTTTQQKPQDHPIDNPLNSTVIMINKDAKNSSNDLQQVKDCNCKHDVKNTDNNSDSDLAVIKVEKRIDQLKLSSEHQLELMKLEDRKEERQFQIQLTKLQQDYEIMKLRLQIKLERMKNLNKSDTKA